MLTLGSHSSAVARRWRVEGSEGEGEESRGSPAHPAQVLGETQGGSLACPSGWLSAHRAGVAGQPGGRGNRSQVPPGRGWAGPWQPRPLTLRALTEPWLWGRTPLPHLLCGLVPLRAFSGTPASAHLAHRDSATPRRGLGRETQGWTDLARCPPFHRAPGAGASARLSLGALSMCHPAGPATPPLPTAGSE